MYLDGLWTKSGQKLYKGKAWTNTGQRVDLANTRQCLDINLDKAFTVTCINCGQNLDRVWTWFGFSVKEIQTLSKKVENPNYEEKILLQALEFSAVKKFLPIGGNTDLNIIRPVATTH